MNHRISTLRHSLVRSSLVLAACSTALLAACSKHDRDEAGEKVKDAYADTKAAVARTWEQAKSYTYEQRTDFVLELKARQAELEAELSRMRAEYSEAQATASRKAAMEELRNAEAHYKEKLNALGTATSDTWQAGRDDVIAAWDRLQAAYAKARAD